MPARHVPASTRSSFHGFAVRAVEAPTDARPGQPTLYPGKSLLAGVEAEAPGHRFSRRKVEHLRGRYPAAGQFEQVGGHGQHRVGLSQRAVGEPRPQRGRPGHDGGPKGGVDQGSEQLDVGAHHDHVPGLERRVVRQ